MTRETFNRLLAELKANAIPITQEATNDLNRAMRELHEVEWFPGFSPAPRVMGQTDRPGTGESRGSEPTSPAK